MLKLFRTIAHHITIIIFTGLLILFSFTNNSFADNVITANLFITPSPNVNPGAKLSFKGIVFNNPDFTRSPGTRMRCRIVKPDFTHVTETIDIDYPGPGHKVQLNFTNKFSIPDNAKNGTTYNFYLVYGIYYPLSAKASVKVIPNRLRLHNKKLPIKTKKFVNPRTKITINPQPEPPGKIK